MAKTAQKEASKRRTPVLYVGIELSGGYWRFAFRDGRSDRTSENSVPARKLDRMLETFERAKRKLDLPPKAVIRTCYEAGRDGFWLHRWLTGKGIENLVLDAASIQVNRRKRREKTDRLDALSLVAVRIRLARGETEAARVCRVPTEDQEDLRREPRERKRLKHEETAHRARIASLLALHGAESNGKPEHTDFEKVISASGAPLPENARRELQREQERLLLVCEQRQQIDKARQRELREHLRQQKDRSKDVQEEVEATGRSTTTPNAKQQALDMTIMLMTLKGVGATSACDIANEFLFRRYENGRQVGSAAGLTGSPYASGGTIYEQGISKAGNKRIRPLMVELAWTWLRHQPGSELSKWFKERFGMGKRMRRVGIVALARRLLVAFWRYVEHGVVPDGAILRDPAKAI